MKITIGKFDKDAGTVTVTFAQDGKVHTRQVNAAVTAAGKLDSKATRDRVEQVGRGVARKFELGLLADPETSVEAD